MSRRLASTLSEDSGRRNSGTATRDQYQMRMMDKLTAGSGSPRQTSTRESKAVDLLHAIQHAKRHRGVEQGADRFARLLETIPDGAPHELSDDSMAFVVRIAEDVIAEIEKRVNLDADRDSVQLNLVKSVYRIRRALEEIDRWQRHYTDAAS